MLTAQELSATYNNNVKNIIISYNNAVAAILKQRGSNNIKQSYLNNLKQQYLANTLTLKTKYMDDLASLLNTVAEEPVVAVAEEPVVAEPVVAVAEEPAVADEPAVAEEPVIAEEPVMEVDN